jgi:HAMP domain-containing protein
VSQARSQRSGFGRRGKATRIGLSMRWWLAILFALIAAVTAVSVAYVLTVRSERALRDRAEETAAGYAFRAALAINDAEREQLEGRVETLAEERRVALFVYDEGGLLLTQRESFGIDVSDVPRRKEALAEAEEGRRFLATLPEARATVVALPLRTASGADALIAYVPSPEYGASIGILRGEIARSALLAVLVGAVVGALVAFLIARRLRRIAATAAEIERGHFDQSLHPVFRDEVGELAATVERMRARLRASFDELESERDRLSRLLEQLHEGVVAVNRDMEVVVANSPAARALAQPHLKEGDSLPQPWPDFSLRDFAKRLFDPGVGIQEARVSPDAEHTYSVTGIPAGPDPETAVLVLGDVSERERREHAEREFVTNAAHELRTPLQTILGAVEVLQAGAKERPVECERFLGHIEREATRLARLAKALLILARVQAALSCPLSALIAKPVPCWLLRDTRRMRDTDAMLGNASPRKPSVPTRSRSSMFVILLVACRDSARPNSSRSIPHPSSRTRHNRTPPSSISTSTRLAPASRLFSTSSLMMDAGRSTTSPAAIW